MNFKCTTTKSSTIFIILSFLVLLLCASTMVRASASAATDETLDNSPNENSVTFSKDGVKIDDYATIQEAINSFLAREEAETGSYKIEVGYRLDPYAEDTLILYQRLGKTLDFIGVPDSDGNKPTLSCKNTKRESSGDNYSFALGICAYSDFGGAALNISGFNFDISQPPSDVTSVYGICPLSNTERYAHLVTIDNCYCFGSEGNQYVFIGNAASSGSSGFVVNNCKINNVGYFVSGYFCDNYSKSFKALELNNCVAENPCKAFVNLISGQFTLSLNNCSATTYGTYAVRGGKGDTQDMIINVENCNFSNNNTSPKENGGLIVTRGLSNINTVNIKGNNTFNRVVSTNEYTIYDVYNDSSSLSQITNVAANVTINTVLYGLNKIEINKTEGFNFEPVASIGQLHYVFLQQAFNASVPSDTIKLLKDKITVKDYGSDSYGKWTEITADTPTSEIIGTAMEPTALANIVLRKDNGAGNPNTLINSYDGTTRPSGYITIEGLEDGGTEVGSLDLSGADCIKIKNLNFNADNKIGTYCFYGAGSAGTKYTINSNKDKVAACTTITKNSNNNASIVDTSYAGSLAASPDPSNSAAVSIEITGCSFSGFATYESSYSCVYTYCQGATGYRPTDWTIDSCDFNTCAGQALSLWYLHNEIYPEKGAVNVTNNMFGSMDNYFHGECVSCGTGTFGDINISGNTFWNWRGLNEGGASVEEPYHSGAIWSPQPQADRPINLTIKNNKFLYNTKKYTAMKYHTSVRIPYIASNPDVTLNGTKLNLADLPTFYKALTDENFGNLNSGVGAQSPNNRIYWTIPDDEMKYEVSFNTDGGAPSPDAQYIKKGNTATKPTTDPQKLGYVFRGWYLDDATEPFDFNNSPITEPITLTAKWEEDTTTYQVTFDADGGTPAPETQTVQIMHKATKPTQDPSKTGHTFLGWYDGDELFNFDTPIVANVNLKAKYNVNSYSISYTLNDGQWAQGYSAPTQYTYGVGVALPVASDVIKTGFSFGGWYDNEQLSGSPVTAILATDVGNKAYYAKWSINSYTVTFDADGGQPCPETQTVKYYQKAAQPKTNPSKTGYAFDGWYKDGDIEPYNFDTPVTSDVNLKAHYKVGIYSISYTLNDGQWAQGYSAPTQYTYGVGVALPVASDVIKTGFSFGGWYDNEQLSGSPVTAILATDVGNKAYYAKWSINSYTVTFDADGGQPCPETQTVQYNQKAAQPKINPSKTGYTFDGWYKDDDIEPYNFDTPVTSDVNLKALYKVGIYSISYTLNDGQWAQGYSAPTQYTYGVGVALPVASDVTKTGYSFGGWYDNEQLSGNPVTAISASDIGNKAYYAKWSINSYTVTFDADGGEPCPETQTVKYNQKATQPKINPSKIGYTFDGWYKDDDIEPYNFDTPVTSDINLKAHYKVGIYSISYTLNDGQWAQGYSAPIQYTFGVGVALPVASDVIKTGFSFGGWYDNEQLSGSPVTAISVSDVGNKAYYAKWSINSYTVTFDADGGEPCPETQTVKYNQKATKPTLDPIKEGCIFQGWFMDGETYPFDFDTPITKSITLKAHWKTYQVTVTFNSNGGSPVDAQVIDAGQIPVKPSPDPTKEGYVFKYWMYLDASGSSTYNFNEPLYADLELNASWATETGEVVVVEPVVPVDEETGQEIVVIDEQAKQDALENAEQIVEDAKSGKDVSGLTKKENIDLRDTLGKVQGGQTSVTILIPAVYDYEKTVPDEEKQIIKDASLPNSEIACSYDFSMEIVVKIVDSLTGQEIPGIEPFIASLTTIDKAVDYKVRLSLPPETYEDSAIQVLKVHQMIATDITKTCEINRIEHYVDVPAYEFSTYLINTSNSLYLSFDSQGGSLVNKQVVKYNTAPVKPNNPTKNGYTFEGWYIEPECQTTFDFNKPMTIQQTVYAKWKENGGGGGGGDTPGGGGDSPSGVSSGGAASTGDFIIVAIAGLLIGLFASATVMAFSRKTKNRL